jgi:DNA-binding response OmpR family regulator
MTPCPRRLLDCLVAANGPVDSRELMTVVDPRPTTSQTNLLRFHIHRIRAELGFDAIRTIRGHGYALAEDCRQRIASFTF